MPGRNKALFALMTAAIAAIAVMAAAGCGGRVPVKAGQAVFWNGEADTGWYDRDKDVFVINTAEELAGLAKLVNEGEGNAGFKGKTVKLGRDIIINDTAKWRDWANNPPVCRWTAIGTGEKKAFRGAFDGGGHTVSGVYVNSPKANFVGLFGFVGKEAMIRNLGVTASYFKGRNAVGGLVGGNGYWTHNGGWIINSYSTATVAGEEGYIGGLAGFNAGSKIIGCYATGAVSGGENVGGLVGRTIANGGTISDCYSTGNVSGDSAVGGLVGNNEKAAIQTCYTISAVTGIKHVGGLVGKNSCNCCAGRISNCLFRCRTSGAECGYYGETAERMKKKVTFTGIGWDFDRTWGIDSTVNDGYPHLLGKSAITGGPGEVWASTDWYTANPNARTFSISTADELAALAEIVNGEADGILEDGFRGKTVRLAADIDLSGYDNWVPIGKTNRWSDGNVFRGTFDGGGHVVKNLTVKRSEERYQGLFGYIEGGTVKNLGVENVNVSGKNQVGGIVGYFKGDNDSISNCHTTGKVSGTTEVGGIAGYVDGKSSIINCYSTAAVSARDSRAGGLAGAVWAGFVSNSYFAGSVSGGNDIGGLIGDIRGYDESVVTGCYSIGAVAGKYNTGGLAGSVGDRNRISDCAALGPKVTGGLRWPKDRYYRDLGRVTGKFAGHIGNTLEHSNNAAWAGMKNSAGNIDWPHEDAEEEDGEDEGCTCITVDSAKAGATKDGADITTDDIKADATIGGRFTAQNGWTIENGKLPGLRGKAVEMPAHLNAAIYGINSIRDASVSLGGTRKFATMVFGIQQVDKSVKWAITGNTSDLTVISDDGLLNVGINETAADITVTATAAADTGFSVAAKVEIDTSLYANWHANTRWYAGSPGAASFTISTAGELAGLAQIVNGTTRNIARDSFGGKTIKLAGNIDLSEYKRWTPIGNFAVDTLNVFAGTFDGGGHIISKLTVKAPENGEESEWCGEGRLGYQGLFGHIRGGSVENLGLDSVDILGGEYVGGIAGAITGRSRIVNCYSNGEIQGERYPVGGVAGWVDGHSGIVSSYSSGEVISCHGTGGVAGDVSRNSSVTNCYSTAEVMNSSEAGYSGGIAGSVSGNSVVANCYFAGEVGHDLYATVGGVAGIVWGNGKVTGCAALNPDLMYGHGAGSRIVGNDDGTTALSNNAAGAGMKNSGGGTNWPGKGAGKRNGADITAARIKADGTIGGRFTNKNGWTIKNGKLPGLGGKAVEMPEHLR